MAVMRPDHELAHRRQVTLSELAPYPLAMPQKNITMRRLIDACCSRRNVLLEPTMAADSISALLCFVMSGNGIGFSAALPIRRLVREGQLVALPIRDKDMNTLQLEIQSLAGRTLPDAARAFLNTLIARASTPHAGSWPA